MTYSSRRNCLTAVISQMCYSEEPAILNGKNKDVKCSCQ